MIVAIMIALAVNGLMINPAYLWLIQKVNLNFKPFNCVYCLSFWLAVIYIAIQAITGAFAIQLVFVPLATSFLAVVIERWVDNLPMIIK